MTKKCIMCKAVPTTVKKRSFHIFPSNEAMRQKWIESINLSKTPNFKTTYICSDHFDEKDFFYTDELRTRRRLHLNSIPRLTSTTKLSKVISTNNYQEETEIHTNKMIITNSSSFDKSNIADDVDLQQINNDNSLTVNNQSNNHKRKTILTNAQPIKKVRFMTNLKTEYLCQKDFISEEAWNKFQRYLAYQRSRIAAAHNKNSRKHLKIKTLNRIINTLERK